MESGSLSRIGIIGVGTMGARIAFRCAISGKEAYVFDTYPHVLEKAMKKIEIWLDERVKDGRLTVDQAQIVSSRLHPCNSLKECLATVVLAVETVPEDLELKRRVFVEMDRLAPRHVLFTTNSSSLPCSRIAGQISRPDKIFNINFTDPSDDNDKLVEIMGGPETAKETITAGVSFVRSLNMVPVVTKKEIMGFSFNRIWRAIKREGLHLVDEGYADFEDIDRAWMLEFRIPYGPFAMMDRVGLDVVRDIEMQYFNESGDERDKPPRILEKLVTQGRLGVKSGQGFYTYPNPAYEQPGWLMKMPPWDQVSSESEC